MELEGQMSFAPIILDDKFNKNKEKMTLEYCKENKIICGKQSYLAFGRLFKNYPTLLFIPETEL